MSPSGGAVDLEGVDHSAQHREVVRGRRHLHHPPGVVPPGERVEGRLVHLVGAHELADVDHDVALVGGEGGRVAPGAQHVDGRLAHPVAPRLRGLGRPDVGRLALPHRGQDGHRAELALDRALVAEERDQGQQTLGERRAVQQHAERPAHAAEDLHDLVHDAVVGGGNFRFAGDGGDAWHGALLSRGDQPWVSPRSTSKYSGNVLDTQAGLTMRMPGARRPVTAKLIAMRWSS